VFVPPACQPAPSISIKRSEPQIPTPAASNFVAKARTERKEKQKEKGKARRERESRSYEKARKSSLLKSLEKNQPLFASTSSMQRSLGRWRRECRNRHQ
jgi:hypothetical protein